MIFLVNMLGLFLCSFITITNAFQTVVNKSNSKDRKFHNKSIESLSRQQYINALNT